MTGLCRTNRTSLYKTYLRRTCLYKKRYVYIDRWTEMSNPSFI